MAAHFNKENKMKPEAICLESDLIKTITLVQ